MTKQNTLIQVVSLPRQGLIGLWDKAVSAVTGKPVPLSKINIIVSFEVFALESGAIALGNVTARLVRARDD